MGKLIIVEGSDGSGKTTLIERLLNLSEKYVFEKHGPYKGEANITHHYARSLENARRLPYDMTLVLDRSWIAEPVYGNAFRGGLNRVSFSDWQALEIAAKNLFGVVVLAHPSLDKCIESWSSRRGIEMLETQNQLRMVHEEYGNILNGSLAATSLPVIRFNYEVHDENFIIAEIDRVRNDIWG